MEQRDQLRNRLGIGQHEVGGLVEPRGGAPPGAVNYVEVVVGLGRAFIELGEELQPRYVLNSACEGRDAVGEVEHDDQLGVRLGDRRAYFDAPHGEGLLQLLEPRCQPRSLAGGAGSSRRRREGWRSRRDRAGAW